ncbi:unnamed protein product [Schistosoma turkestanicum]|nr:unnamed protein product [Schistosoma turkestanicum]
MNENYKTSDMNENKRNDNIKHNGEHYSPTGYTLHSNVCPNKLLNTSTTYSSPHETHDIYSNSSVLTSTAVLKSFCPKRTTNLSTVSNHATNCVTHGTTPFYTKHSNVSNNLENGKNSDQLNYLILPQNNYIPFYTLQRSSLYTPVCRTQTSLSCQPSPNIADSRVSSDDLVSQSSVNEFRNGIHSNETSKYPTENIKNSSLSSINSSNNSFRSLDENSSSKLKNYQFFHRFLKYSSKLGRKTKSAKHSPSSSLSSPTSPIHSNSKSFKNTYTPGYNVCSPMMLSSNVKLIDTCLIKRPSGFGLTLCGVITFIPKGILDINTTSHSPDKQEGFFQRLLQIRSVSDNVLTYDNDLVQSRGKNNSIRSGDILLAAGGFRLAGYTPEYAVQLLAKIPVGSAIQITLLRGLGIPSINSLTGDDISAKYLYELKSASLCSSMSSSSELSPNKTNSNVEAQIKSKFAKSYVKHVAINNDNQLNKTKLQPGDLIVKIGKFDVTNLTKSQFSQLLNVYSKSNSMQFTVIQVCSNCLKQINYANVYFNFKKSTNNYLNLNEPPLTSTTLPTVTEANKTEMISFLRTVLNPNGHSKKSTNPNLQTNNKYFSSNTPDLSSVNNSSVNEKSLTWLPEQCITPGIGKSGPCETPDYIPISQLLNTLNTNNHQISTPSRRNNIRLRHNDQKPDVPNQNQHQINEPSQQQQQQQQQPNVNYQHSDGILSHQLSSPFSSPSIQTENPHKQTLNNHEINTDNINHDHLTEKDMKILYSTKDGKLNFVKENIEQDLPCIQSVESNTGLDKSCQNLLVGDLLVAIENHSVLNCKPNEIEELLRLAAKNNNGFVTLTVRRIHSSNKTEDMKISEIPIKDTDSSNIINVKLSKEKDEGFGFVIVSSLNKEKASEIGRIIPGSPADKCGKLEVGQRILGINGYWLQGLNHMDIVNLIRQSQQQLILTIEKIDSLSGEQHHSRIDSLDTDEKFIPLVTSTMLCSNETVCFRSMNGSKSSELLDENETVKSSFNNTSTKSPFSITLQRGPNGFGFSVRSGFNSSTSPLTVYRIAENGPAFQQGQMKVGDEILEINGISTFTMTHQQAVTMIRSSGPTLRILLQHFNEDQCENYF